MQNLSLMPEKLKVDTRITVETPEGVDFQFVIAGPGKRAVSFVIDTLLKVAAIVVPVLLMVLIFDIGPVFAEMVASDYLLAWFTVSWIYGACFEAFLHGRTPGKISQSLRVVRTNGTPIGWFEAFGRNLLLIADGFLVLGPLALNTVGLISMAATRRMQRLGDVVFDTMVIDEQRNFITRSVGITDDVDALQRAECTSRFHVPERTLAVIERLFEGDRLISEGRREEIARSLSLQLRQRLGYTEPGPDPLNPNTYFTASPKQHTVFLKRILRTFADDGKGDTGNDAPGKRAGRSTRRSNQATADAATLSLDRIVAEAATFEADRTTATATLEPAPNLTELTESDLSDKGGSP